MTSAEGSPMTTECNSAYLDFSMLGPRQVLADLDDHDDLRRDPLLAAVVGKPDPTGQTRRRRRDQGKALAGKSTLNRLELTPVGADQDSRYKKITCNTR